eukprot:m.37588 g.37588  ORF g.37588 m.37588 type:complete len:176 (+) comp11566_c0_seq1:151-678(+)
MEKKSHEERMRARKVQLLKSKDESNPVRQSLIKSYTAKGRDIESALADLEVADNAVEEVDNSRDELFGTKAKDIRVSVKAEPIEDYHVFLISISVREYGQTQTVVGRKRYADLLRLHQACLKREPDEAKTLNFPPKAALGNRSDDFVEKRVQEFQAFFEQVAENPSLRGFWMSVL